MCAFEAQASASYSVASVSLYLEEILLSQMKVTATLNTERVEAPKCLHSNSPTEINLAENEQNAA